MKPIKSALISVFNKDGLTEILRLLNNDGVKFISTGGTKQFIESEGYQCTAVESLTGYPSIFGGRVKTLHPKIFGGILYRRDNETDLQEKKNHEIEGIDLVIVDLYPFADTVASGASDEDIIEKIDIGGISLIRGAAKNFNDVAIVASKAQYPILAEILKAQGANTTLEQRRDLARLAFGVSSEYDSAIFNWFDRDKKESLRLAVDGSMPLRYGENPHQSARFYGDFDAHFTKLHGKDISYNNLLDIDAAIGLIAEFKDTAVAILKHSNPCGVAEKGELKEVWTRALACDPVSAFGGVIVVNRPVDAATAAEIDKIFFEVIIAPDYSPEALELLYHKKNRIVLKAHEMKLPSVRYRSAVCGILAQDTDMMTEKEDDLKPATDLKPTAAQTADMIFANKIVKHCKSNAIVLAKAGNLLAAGVGQTSRVDSLRQAIDKARAFGFDLKGATMASDAFFPFADCVEIAYKAGIDSVVQPGGSIRDKESIDYCQENGIVMTITGHRHFKH